MSGGVGHERTGLTEGVERVDRVIEPGSTRGRHRIAGRGSVERILRAAARFLLLGRELIEPIGRSLTERLERLGGPVRGGVGASEACVDRTRVVTRAGKIERRAERFDGVSRTSELHKAVAKLGKGRRGRRVCTVDRRLAKRRARLGNAVQSEERPAKAELRFVRGGIGAVLERLGEAPDGALVIADGRKSLALIRKKRAALAISSVVQGERIGRCRLAGQAELHKGVTAKVIDLASNLRVLLAGGKHLCSSGKIACAISGAGTLEQFCVHGILLR